MVLAANLPDSRALARPLAVTAAIPLNYGAERQVRQLRGLAAFRRSPPKAISAMARPRPATRPRSRHWRRPRGKRTRLIGELDRRKSISTKARHRAEESAQCREVGFLAR